MKKMLISFFIVLMILSISANYIDQTISLELDQICLKEFINCLSYSNNVFDKEEFENKLEKKINLYFDNLDHLSLKKLLFNYGQANCQIGITYEYYFFSKTIIKEVGLNERKNININNYLGNYFNKYY